MSERVAIVGYGLVGSARALVFARAGWRVRLYDEEALQLAAAEDRIAVNARELVRHELLEDAPPVLARIESRPPLEDALEDASYVQESVLENADVKRALYRRWTPSSAAARSSAARPRASRRRCSQRDSGPRRAASLRIRSNRPT